MKIDITIAPDFNTEFSLLEEISFDFFNTKLTIPVRIQKRWNVSTTNIMAVDFT